MISWIQNTFQKHFRTIFVALLAILIVSFVFTIGAAPGIGQADGQAMSRTFYGVNLGSAEEADRLFGDANLSVMLQAGYQALDEARLQDYAFQRQAALHLAEQLNLPRPTREELAEHVRGMALFTGQDGQFDPQAYSRFRDSLKTNPRFGEAALARVLADDVVYERVQALLGGPGYVLDRDVRQQIERAETSWQINLAKVDYASFQPELNPTEAELKTWFDANAFRYEVPPHVRVEYVEFPASAFADRVTLTDADIRAHYEANPGRFPNPAKQNQDNAAVTEAASSDEDFAAVRSQVESALRLERARRLALNAASDLTVALYDARATPENVREVLSGRGHTLKSAPPFPRNQPPAFLGGNAQSAAEAFKLNQARPVSDALPTPQGAVVLVWQETLAAHPANFADVQEQVRKDYVDNQRRQRFATLGRTLQTEIRAKVNSGSDFATAAAEVAQAHNVKVETSSHGPFPRNSPPQEVPYPALSALDNLQTGEVSNLIISGDQGLLVHAAAKEQPDVGPADGRFAEVRNRMAQSLASANASELLREMVRVELDRTEPGSR